MTKCSALVSAVALAFVANAAFAATQSMPASSVTSSVTTKATPAKSAANNNSQNSCKCCSGTGNTQQLNSTN